MGVSRDDDAPATLGGILATRECEGGRGKTRGLEKSGGAAQEWCYNRDDYPRASSSAAIMFS